MGFRLKTYLEGGYIQELKQEAQAQGLTLVERDGRLYCFPLVLRIEPRELTIRIGNKRDRCLRPKEIVSQLASTPRMQLAPGRLSFELQHLQNRSHRHFFLIVYYPSLGIAARIKRTTFQYLLRKER